MVGKLAWAGVIVSIVLFSSGCNQADSSDGDESLSEAAQAAKGAVYGGQGKTTVCHDGSTIEVGNPALSAHLAHGDTLGVCPPPDDGGDDAGGGDTTTGTTTSTGTTTDTGTGDPPPPPQCKANGESCSTDYECCTGTCSSGVCGDGGGGDTTTGGGDTTTGGGDTTTGTETGTDTGTTTGTDTGTDTGTTTTTGDGGGETTTGTETGTTTTTITPVCTADGDACDVDAECCAGSWCSDDACTSTPKDVGESCNNHIQCASGECFDGACINTNGACVDPDPAEGDFCSPAKPCCFADLENTGTATRGHCYWGMCTWDVSMSTCLAVGSSCVDEPFLCCWTPDGVCPASGGCQ